MAAKKKQPNLIAKLPDNIRDAPVMRKQSVRPSGITKYQKEMFLLFMPEISRWFFTQLRAGVAKGDKTLTAMWAEMTGHILRNKGININQIMSQQNRLDGNAAPRYSMDQIVRELQAQSELKTIDVANQIEPGGSDAIDIAVEA